MHHARDRPAITVVFGDGRVVGEDIAMGDSSMNYARKIVYYLATACLHDFAGDLHEEAMLGQ